jgi:hypothetical protein
VESCDYQTTKPPPLEALPDGGACRIVELGAPLSKLRLFVAQTRPELAGIKTELQKGSGDIIDFVENPADGDWALDVMSPDQARKLKLEYREDTVLLYSTDTAELPAEGRSPIHVQFPIAETTLAKKIEAELRKIIAWTNVWKIGHLYGEQSSLVSSHRIRLNVARTPHEPSTSGANDKLDFCHPGDKLEVRLSNGSFEDYWYSLFFVSGNYGILHVRSGSIRARNPKDLNETAVQLLVDRMEVTGAVSGVQGYVVVAVPIEEHKIQPDLSFLSQTPLGITDQSRAIPQHATTVFDQLLVQSSKGRPLPRGTNSPDNPRACSRSWKVVVPQNP